MKLLASALAAIALGATAQTVGAAPAATVWFHSPSGNIGCQVSPGGVRGKTAYCQTVHPAESVTLHADGRLSICRGGRCLGNGPENQFMLGYGRHVLVGPFRCASSRTQGIACVVRQTGRGFAIARQGITRIG